MKNIFTIIKMLALILPMIIELVRSIESNAPGAEKKMAVMDIARMAMEKAGAGGGVVGKVMDVADSAIDIAVALFNKSGEFERGGGDGDPTV